VAAAQSALQQGLRVQAYAMQLAATRLTAILMWSLGLIGEAKNKRKN